MKMMDNPHKVPQDFFQQYWGELYKELGVDLFPLQIGELFRAPESSKPQGS